MLQALKEHKAILAGVPFALLYGAVSFALEALNPGVIGSAGELTARGVFLEALVFSLVLFFGGWLVGLVAIRDCVGWVVVLRWVHLVRTTLQAERGCVQRLLDSAAAVD